MPSAGYSHFYFITSLDDISTISGVSMPSAGYSHFYGLYTAAKHQIWKCVNALGGLFSFLLIGVVGVIVTAVIWCQCPRRAILISTRATDEGTVFYAVCQCPRRAILISTVPSGSPHKYWLSSPIFAGICLNILKSSVFSPFLVLFTICSYLDAFYTSSDTVNIILYLPI